MKLIPKNYDGFSLNSAIIKSKFIDPYAWSLAGSTANVLSMGDSFPIFGSKTLQEKVFSIDITMKCPSEQRNAMAAALSTYKVEQKILLAEDLDTGKQWYLYCTVTGLVANDREGYSFTATFTAPNPVWISYKTTSVATDVYTSGTTITLPPYDGNYPTQPVIEIEPIVDRVDGYQYSRRAIIYNNSYTGFTNYPIDITNGGMDTAALVSTGKMRSDGNDLRVFVNNKEVDRWLSGMNTSSTKVWINFPNVSRRISFTLKTAIAATGDVTQIFLNDRVTISGYSGYRYWKTEDLFESSGFIVIGSEMFLYNGVDISNGCLNITGRAVFGSSAASHSVNASGYNYMDIVQIAYGDPTAVAPVTNDIYKPTFDIDASTNSSWVFDGFFGSYAGERRMQSAQFNVFTFSLYGGSNFIYGCDSDCVPKKSYSGYSSDPLFTFDGMGIMFATNAFLGGPESVFGGNVSLSCGCQISSITDVEIKTYRNSAKWPLLSINSYNIPPPSINTCTTLSVASIPVTSSTKVQFSSNNDSIGPGLISSTVGLMAFAVITKMTIGIANSPSITLQAEDTSYYVDAILENVNTGESLILNGIFTKNQKFTIDCENRVAYDSTGQNMIESVTKNTIRNNWLNIGENFGDVIVLKYTEIGIQQVTVTITYRSRLT